MRNPLGYLGYILLIVFTSSIILQSTSRDYLTTFTSETKPIEVLSPSPPKNATVRVVENPDGSRQVFVEASVNLRVSTSVNGQFFDSSKYETYVISTLIQEKTLGTLKDIWDRYFEHITLFVTVLSIPFALLVLTTKKVPFSM